MQKSHKNGRFLNFKIFNYYLLKSNPKSAEYLTFTASPVKKVVVFTLILR